jgi:LacI family transcriptional regulator
MDKTLDAPMAKGKTVRKENGIVQPTALDVARLAGVSSTQVSYVLNNKFNDHVSPAKRERILKAARELGYHPHQSAQALRKGYANEFALFFPAPYTNRINRMLGTIHEMGLADGCVPVQYSFNAHHELARKQAAFYALLARKPRGLFLSLFDVTMEEIEFARSRGIDRILIHDVEDHPGFLTLKLPIEEIGFLAAQHLLARGHRNIALIRPFGKFPVQAYNLRLAGMRKAMKGYKGARLTELLWPDEDPRQSMDKTDEFISSSGLDKKIISGIYAYSDEYAFPLIAGLLDRGIRIPDEIAIIGTDDLPYASIIRPSLTTIRFDQKSLGERAVAMINALITGQSFDQKDELPLKPVLVQRQT